MLERHALFHKLLEPINMTYLYSSITYKKPVANKRLIPIRFFRGILSLQTNRIGSTSMATSEAIFNKVVKMLWASPLIQWPPS